MSQDQQQRDHSDQKSGRPVGEEWRNGGAGDRGNQRRKRGIAAHQRDREPDQRRDQRHRPGQRDQYAEGRRHPFAAAKPEPHREHMAEDHAKPRRPGAGCAPERRAIAAASTPLPSRAARSAPPALCCRCATRWSRRCCPSRCGECRHSPANRLKHQAKRDRTQHDSSEIAAGSGKHGHRAALTRRAERSCGRRRSCA